MKRIFGYKIYVSNTIMNLILDTENSHPTIITVRGKDITLLLIESSILIDSSQVAKIFDKKEKTVATKVQKSKLENTKQRMLSY
ncbi:hypothetical protein [Methanobrevibacter sp.]|uniref:hypothetical protein n=1 Tax=Methanobrevibacter sp. TaxID=66852 RepID=UPI0025E2EEE3|nr:hypothetical protein [Methanobrevibacter sp.]